VPVPDVIGRYRVRERLGSGAFATVWLATDEALDSLVAVKVLAENWAHHVDVRTRFTQEAQIMRRADSDRLVRVFDVGELPDGRPYLVMTYADGGTLADLLAAGPLPVDVAVRMAADIARGVAVLHAAGAIHRDLKPSNILLRTAAPEALHKTPYETEHPQVLVADLGLAKAIAHASGFTVVAGSPGYMAPEQTVPGGGIDVRADVYAIGALAFHMLTGGPPRNGRTRPSAVRPGIPGVVDNVVQRALRPRRQDRYSSADAVAVALASTMDRKPRKRRAVHAVLALATAAVATFVPAASSAGADAGLVRVSDVSGRLSIAVPAGWAKQFRDAGWDPGTLRFPAGSAPGLVVGPDLTAWADPASHVPGMFAGLTPPLAADTGGISAVPALPDHQGCVRQPERRLRLAGFDARVLRWTQCAGARISFSEVLLVPPQGDFGVYVQLKQIDGIDRTDRLLGRLRVH
jgi:hypothetical protein